jgi:hypothetical protein
LPGELVGALTADSDQLGDLGKPDKVHAH